MASLTRFPTALGLTAALSMLASPLAATDFGTASSHKAALPQGHAVFDADDASAQDHRDYRYRRGGYGHYRNHVGTGDVLAGVLIIGGIAAIASAASRKEAERRESHPVRQRGGDYDYRDRRGDARFEGARGIERAAQICVTQIERDVRVETVDSIDRNGEGWRVTGTLYNGEGFTCHIGPDGRVDTIDYAGFARSTAGQSGDDRYRAAWANVDAARGAPTQQTNEPQPAYPGGPIPGESADDRYQTGEAPE